MCACVCVRLNETNSSSAFILVLARNDKIVIILNRRAFLSSTEGGVFRAHELSTLQSDIMSCFTWTMPATSDVPESSGGGTWEVASYVKNQSNSIRSFCVCT